MSKLFDSVNIEISGICNAKCPYCVTGASRHQTGSFIDIELFENTIKILLEKNLINTSTIIYLYNWGEPTIHPKFDEIINIINKYDLKYALSTNAGKSIDFKKDYFKNLYKIVFSMPGFSQNSYNRIHGFDFNKVKNNIINIAKNAKKYNFKGSLEISSHVYQFNLDEIPELEKFATLIEAKYSPYYAYINDWWKLQEFIDSTIPTEELKSYSEDLFIYYIQKALKEAPKKYNCPQHSKLNIDENGNIITCCVVPRNHENYKVGHIYDDNLMELFKKKNSQPVCTYCNERGIAYYAHNFVKPTFYTESDIYKSFVKYKNRTGIKKLIAYYHYNYLKKKMGINI